jgi:hypothetical protein
VRSIALPSWIERLAGLEPRPLPPFAFALTRQELAFAGFSAEPAGARTLLESQGLPLSDGLFGGGPLGVPVGERASLAASVRLLVGRLAKAPKEAALVLPDAWVRGLMLEAAELPDDAAARLEVLRFRLKRLVPFRVEDLRIEATALGANGVAAGDGDDERAGGGRRAFATFGNEAVLAAIEGAFADAGVRVGWISGATAALHAGLVATLAPAAGDDGRAPLLGLAHVDSDGFSLVVSQGGEPLVWRQKLFTESLSDADRERLLIAELRLTRTFLEGRRGGEAFGPGGALFLSVPRAVEPFWTRVLEEGLGASPQRLRPEHLGLASSGEGVVEGGLLPLAGAVAREIG